MPNMAAFHDYEFCVLPELSKISKSECQIFKCVSVGGGGRGGEREVFVQVSMPMSPKQS